MQEQIKTIKENAINEIKVTEDLKILNDLRVKYLGKKGELTLILRGMGALTPEERPVIGAEVNKAKEEVESLNVAIATSILLYEFERGTE